MTQKSQGDFQWTLTEALFEASYGFKDFQKTENCVSSLSIYMREALDSEYVSLVNFFLKKKTNTKKSKISIFTAYSHAIVAQAVRSNLIISV